MKKLIGIIGIVALALAMFFSTNTLSSSNGKMDLASLASINTADAECPSGSLGICLYVTSGGMSCAYYPNGTCK